MTAAKREIIYIDVEDEITSVIDKVVSAKTKIIALVPPKRAAMLQSIVNMKLLKRSADQASKKIVLVTSESSLLPLAGVAGIHVAKNLQSKPSVPEVDSAKTPPEEVKEAETSIGELSEASAVAEAPLEVAPEEPEDVPDDIDVEEESKPKTAKSDKKGKKVGPKIPNFNSFRSKIFLGVGGFIVLVGGWWLLYKVLPRATVSIKADTTLISVAENITASPGLQTDDLDKAQLIAANKQQQKTLTQTFTPTGQKNVGDKAKGTATFINCNKDDKLSDTTRTIPAGTTISNGDKAFVTNEAVDVEPSSYNGNNCQSNKQSAMISVTAKASGDQYNLSGRAYVVDGFPSITGTGSQMSGGTTKNVQVVSDADVDSAKQKISNQNTDDVKNDLKKLIGDDFVILDDSYTNTPGQVTVTPAVGEEGSSATVSISLNFSLLGIKRDSLQHFIAERAKKHYDASKQKVYDDGVKSVALKLDKKVNDTSYQVGLTTDVFVGPQIDESTLGKDISGKRVGEAEELIKNTPGVQDVRIKLTPFYMTKLPNAKHIKLSFDVSTAKPVQ